jgi:hypothetical protein
MNKHRARVDVAYEEPERPVQPERDGLAEPEPCNYPRTVDASSRARTMVR